ncbi:hypothetical protein F5Y08DRAFT_78812 [Xylaria arbuscula]|nr:hypothetical protein F5Y08DRAFT_78812 [Xylaria arbuscula]
MRAPGHPVKENKTGCLPCGGTACNMSLAGNNCLTWNPGLRIRTAKYNSSLLLFWNTKSTTFLVSLSPGIVMHLRTRFVSGRSAQTGINELVQWRILLLILLLARHRCESPSQSEVALESSFLVIPNPSVYWMSPMILVFKWPKSFCRNERPRFGSMIMVKVFSELHRIGPHSPA